jgi:anti-sigma-K factor RskA
MKQNERRVGPGIGWPLSHQRTHGVGGVVDDDIRVVIHISDVLGRPAPRGPGRQRMPRRSQGLRSRRWGVEQPGASYPFRVDGDTPVPNASPADEAWRAMFALAAGLALAVLSYAQFRGARGELPVSGLTAALTPAVPSDTADAGAALDVPHIVDIVDGVAPPSRPPVVRRRGEDGGRRIEAPAVPVIAPERSSMLDRSASATAVPEPVERLEAAARFDAPAALPPPVAVDERTAAPEPTVPDAPTAAAAVEAVPGDEDHIRAALTRWRVAYSALDARAAREVWPSVDARALERAFQALKSQEVRFDRCDLTVDGGSALAACTGRAIYVPRIGRQSPRTTPRAWTFELKKSDERWTIASARSS